MSLYVDAEYGSTITAKILLLYFFTIFSKLLESLNLNFFPKLIFGNVKLFSEADDILKEPKSFP